MKYIVTGAAGNISKPLAKQLLSAGHKVTIVGRNKDNLKELIDLGAQTAIGSIEDGKFLQQVFKGADAVYTMCPTDMMTNDLRAYDIMLGKNYAEAVKLAGVPYVVNLSSIGAHLDKGAGPVSAIHYVEKELNALKEVHIKHLRPAWFYSNLLSYIPMIRNAGIIGDNFEIPKRQFPMAHSTDIAAVAAEEFTGLDFSGHSYRYIASDETDTDEIATVIGKAIGKPELKWVTFTGEQALEGLLRAGLSKEIATNYVALGNAMNTGKLFEDYKINRPERLGAVKLSDFMTVFTSAYNNN